MARLIILAVLATALGCASSGTAPTSTEPEGGTGFGSEGGDPGIPGSRGGDAGMDPGSNEFVSVYFEFDDFTLRADARAALKHNADVLSRNAGMRLLIEGNCDERGSEEYNLALGQKRADSAKRYLIDLGVAGSRVETISYGEERPAVRGHNELAWSKNRRDDFRAR